MSLVNRKSIISLAVATGATLILLDGNLSATPVIETKPTEKTKHLDVHNPAKASKIDLVFVLDTTGSMGGLIKGAKEKIWSIVNTMSQAKPTPEIRLGIIGYRDRGDAYITDVNQMTTDIDSIYTKLMAYQAGGGGDGPESVNQGLNEAITKMDWSKDKNTYRVVFLVGDYPPHMDYEQDVKYPVTCKLAKEKDITINTVLCGSNSQTRKIWTEIAESANGKFLEVAQSGGAVMIATPYDTKISKLSTELEKTRIAYGDKSQRTRYSAKNNRVSAKLRKASVSATAQRASFNASKAGAKNFGGDCDLLIKIASKETSIDKLKKDKLPEKLQKMDKKELAEHIRKNQQQRKELTQKIRKLSAERQQYMLKKARKSGKLNNSFEKKVFDSIRPQMKGKSIKLEEKDLKL